jgi:hypothetical protein
MGGVSPETCWTSCKYGLINIWYTVASCWTFYELYYDARIHEHQVSRIFRHRRAVHRRCKGQEFFLPKAKAAIRRGGSARRSEIMTCSPFKNSLLNITKIRRAKDPARPKENLYGVPTVWRPSCSGKKKKNKRRTFPVQGTWAIWRLDTVHGMPKMVARAVFFFWKRSDF